MLFVTWRSRLQWIQDTEMFNCIKFSKYCTATKTDAKFYFVIILNHLPTIINHLRTIQFFLRNIRQINTWRNNEQKSCFSLRRKNKFYIIIATGTWVVEHGAGPRFKTQKEMVLVQKVCRKHVQQMTIFGVTVWITFIQHRMSLHCTDCQRCMCRLLLTSIDTAWT